MSKPYFRTLQLTVPEGSAFELFAIGFPPEGQLVAFSISQIAGTPVAAQCQLHSHAPMVPVGDGSSSLVPIENPDQYKIVPDTELAVTEGDPLNKQWDGYYYQNREGSWSARVRRVYLTITPAATTDASEWEVTLGVADTPE